MTVLEVPHQGGEEKQQFTSKYTSSPLLNCLLFFSPFDVVVMQVCELYALQRIVFKLRW